jgi:GNAT superfamily N-acetyltransferase
MGLTPKSPESVRVRTARASERLALEALQWRASLANPGDRPFLLAHPDAIELPQAQIEQGAVFVAAAGPDLAGFAVILPRADGDAELDGLFVEPAWWRRGIGRVLVAHCVERAREHGARALHVVGNAHALAFYAACGFEAVGTTQTRFAPGTLLRRPVQARQGPEPSSPA